MGVLTFEGQEPVAIGFLGFSLTRNDIPGPVVRRDCEIYRKRALSGKRGWSSWQITPLSDMRICKRRPIHMGRIATDCSLPAPGHAERGLTWRLLK